MSIERQYKIHDTTGIKEYIGEYGNYIETLNNCWNYLVQENNENNLDNEDKRMLTALGIYLGQKDRHSC